MREHRGTDGEGRAGSLARASDTHLLTLARSGNSRAFEAIVMRYRPALTRFCGSLTQAERVDDVVQQAFVSAWLALNRGVVVRDLRPWLYTIARNAAIDQHRLRSASNELPLELAGGRDPASIAAGRTYFEEVLQAVAALPERQRVALVETAVHGRSTDAVAGDLGLSGGALRQLVHRARTSVRTAVTSVASGPALAWVSGSSGDGVAPRLAGLLGGAGQGALSVASRTTVAVVSAGALAAGGLVTSAEHRATSTGATKTASAARSGGSVAVHASSARPAAAATTAHVATQAIASAANVGGEAVDTGTRSRTVGRAGSPFVKPTKSESRSAKSASPTTKGSNRSTGRVVSYEPSASSPKRSGGADSSAGDDDRAGASTNDDRTADTARPSGQRPDVPIRATTVSQPEQTSVAPARATAARAGCPGDHAPAAVTTDAASSPSATPPAEPQTTSSSPTPQA